jgi:hypothetical protein
VTTSRGVARAVNLGSRQGSLFMPAVSQQRLKTSVTRTPPGNHRELSHYFEYSSKGIQVLEDGLKEIHFGEYLVESHRLDRYQLFRALQMQDRHPGVRIGECAAALGYVPISEVEKLYASFLQLATVMV